ncbi:TPA: hypothetical protein R5479_001296 [Campylobacter coli]|uniref:DUF6978 family protein n=1 Tax=Campylobacter coli TaxID=195 RepID=UPI001DD9406B|nr:hypothetical protein [Campylobacter coli]HEC2418684.1 hypothetical protein [Campylobacter jejuni]EFN2165261.1 hypothetical protein [Campylobacter coli]HED7326726.1 hypothetical protein [Campylobacter coli]HED7348133.1 hypothetical protein [Campylobacter coli]
MINIKELLSIEKHPKVQQTYILPSFENSKSLKIELQCDDDKYHKENFILDILRSSIQFQRKTNQYRYNAINIIARIDFYASHTNPEFNPNKIPSDKRLSELMEKYSEFRFRNENHIHIFTEGYADKWAFPLSEFNIKTNDDFLNQSYDFCQFCNIINIKFAKGDLFC